MIDPKCLKGTISLGHSNEGFLMPCCWCACIIGDEELKFLSQDHLKLSNVDSVEQIINSEEWNEFFRILKEQPENAPQICKYMCRPGYEFKQRSQY